MPDHPAESVMSRAEVKIVKKRKNRQNASFYALFWTSDMHFSPLQNVSK